MPEPDGDPMDSLTKYGIKLHFPIVEPVATDCFFPAKRWVNSLN